MFEMDMKTITLIIFGIIILYLLYKTRKIEGFAVTDEMKAAIKEIYDADIDAIRNLSSIATDITTKNDTLTIPVGNTIIDGKLTVNGDVEFVNKDTGFINSVPKFTVLAIYSDTVPKGWAPCDGKIYKLNNQGIAIQVVEDGTYCPDLRGRMILGAGAGDGLTNRKRSDGAGGSERISENSLPSHSHNLFDTLDTLVGCKGNNCQNGAGAFRPINGNPTDWYQFGRPGAIPAWTSKTGGGAVHMPPYNILMYIMKL